MSDQKLSIKIETTATGQGVQQTAAAVEKLAGAAQQAAPAMGQMANQSGKTAQELGRGIAVGNAATQAIQNLSGAAQGGAGGLLSLARGAFGAGVAFKGMVAGLSGVGTLIAGVGIAFGFITAAIRKSEEAAKASEDRIAALNKVKLDEAAREQDKLRTAAEAALRVLEAEVRAKEEIADAELAKRKAIVRADARDSGEAADVTERKLLELDRQRDDEKRAAALDLLREKTSRLAAEEDRQTKAAEEQAAKAAKQQQILDTLNARERVAQTTPETTSAMGIPTANPAYARAQEELAAARAAADGITAKTLEQEKAAAEALAKAAAEAKRTADEARATLNIESRKKGALDPIIQATRAAENRAKREPTATEQAAREKARAAAEASIDNFGLGVWQNRAANGMVSEDQLDALKKRYPKVQFRTPEASPAPLTPESLAQPNAQAAPNANRLQLGGGALPGAQPGAGNTMAWGGALPNSQIGAGNQLTRGQLQPGSDNKTAEALKSTTAAVEESDTGEATSKQAEELKKKTEEHAKAVKDSAQKTDTAMTTAGKALAAASGVLTQHNGKLSQHDAEFRRVWGAISALQSSRSA